MSQKIDTEYSGEEYLEVQDSLSGAVLTLEQTLDEYIDTLGEYIIEESEKESELEQSIERTVNSLERVYESLESLDEMIEDERMIARIEHDGKKGFCSLEKNLERLSNGIYSEVNGLGDLLTLFEYIDEEILEADQEHLQASGENVEAPTEMINNKKRMKEIKNNLNRQYDRLAYSEVLARRHTEKELVFDPEPPIFRMLGHRSHNERINKLNKKVKKQS